MFEAVKAADVVGDIPDSFWHGVLFERSICTLAGPSGIGKSRVTMAMVAELSHQFPILYCNVEDDRIIQRFVLEASGANLDAITFDYFQLPAQIPDLAEAVVQTGARLVVFDTAEKTMCNPAGDSLAIQRWGRPLARIQHEVLEPYNVTALFVHHTIRSVKASSDWRMAVGGATNGLTGSSRAIALVGRKPDAADVLIVCPVKTSNTETPKAFSYTFETVDMVQESGDEISVGFASPDEVDLDIPNPTALVVLTGDGTGGKKGPDPVKAAEAADFLTENLKDGPVPVTDCQQCKGCLKHFSMKHVSANGGACPECQPVDEDTVKAGKVKVSPNAVTITIEGLTSRAAREAISFNGAVKRAKSALQIESGRKGAKEKSIPWWRLPDGHPKLSPGAPTELA